MEAPQRSSWLADLPNEILLEILDKLDRFQLNRLIRVNKQLRPLVQYVLEHRKKIRVCGDHSRVIVLSIPSQYDRVTISPKTAEDPKQVPRAALLTHTFFNESPIIKTENFVSPVKERERAVCQPVNNGGKETQITLIEPPMAHNLRRKLYTLATMADLCLLIVDPEEIDTYAEDIKEMIFGCCFMMSARNIIVAIDLSNYPLDGPHALYNTFTGAKIKIAKLLDRTVGTCYTIIPINVRTGTNITANITPKYEWFSGASLKKLILDDQLRTNFDESAYKKLCEAPLRLQLSNVYKVSGIGTVLEGRVISGTLPRHYEGIAIHPDKMYTETRGIEVFWKKLQTAKPGNVIAVVVTAVSKRDVYPQFSYVVSRKQTLINCTIAFRAQIAIMKPDRFAQHQIYTVFYGSSRIPCLLWWIFPGEDGKSHDKSERQFKIKKDLADKPRGNYGSTKELHKAWRTYTSYVHEVTAENKKIMMEEGKDFKRPPKKLLKKATAILLPLIHYDIEPHKPSAFEKNYSGKLMIMEKRTIIGVGRVDRVICNSAETFTIPENKDYKKQYAEVVDRAGSLFTLPQEQKLLELFLDHVTNNERAKRCIQKYKLRSAWMEAYLDEARFH